MDAENRKDVERRLIETEAVIERCSCEETGKDKVKIRGYAAVFYRDNSPAESKDLGGFTERIMPGAFDEAIKRGTDVVALYNHDPMFILGRESSGTLRINVDERGLRYEIDAPESQPAIIEAISRGDVRGSSFAFKVKPEGERWQRDADGRNIRMIDSVDGLYDVGPVLSPAYPSSESFVSQRAINLAQEQAITPSDNPDISDPDDLEEDEIESGLRSEEVDAEERAVSLKPTTGMASAAKRGLRLHEEGKSGSGLKPETVKRAKKIARREEMNRDWVVEMNAWFKRHASDKKTGWMDAGKETPGAVAWLLWGGDAGAKFSSRKVAELERSKERSQPDEEQEKREEPVEETSSEPTAGTLSPNNYDLYERCDQIVEENGLWPQEGPRGCQYQQRSLHGSQGIKCENCVFYNSDNSCDIVEGEVRAEGVCRFWQIPEERLSMEESIPSEEQAESEESRQETAEEKAEVFDTDATIARLKAASLKGH